MDHLATIEIHPDNTASADAWNGDDGRHWVAHAETYERALAGHTPTLVEAAAIDSVATVLDVGCGSGHLTLEAASLASSGQARGVDVSRPLIADARARAAAIGAGNVDFVVGDAQVHRFDGGVFDRVISRHGTLFFADQRAAFANLAAGCRPGARLAVMVWQDIEANEWFREFNDALDAGRPPSRPPVGAPGPFVFAEPGTARQVLEAAGWSDVDVIDQRGPMWFGDDVEQAYAFVSTQGSTRFRIADLDEQEREAALARLRSTLERHQSSGGVTYDSGVWIVTGRRS